MRRFSLSISALVGLLVACCLLSACARKRPDNPVVAAEKAYWLSNGWEFVTVVGTPRGSVEARSTRYSDPQTGSLTVIAPSSALPGNPGVNETRTFKEHGYEFLEEKIMTSPADGYGMSFAGRCNESRPLNRHVRSAWSSESISELC